MNLLRFGLQLTILLLVYTTGVILFLWPAAGLPLVILALAGLARTTVQLTTLGSARWADAYQDIPHLLHGDGIIVGHIAGKPSKWRGVKALFNTRLKVKEACRRFLESCQKKPPKNLVRLTTSVHTAVFAPSGAGKNVSIVEPFLFTTPENCITIDVKGENARITARHRAKEFRHKIIVFDPFRVVTQTPDTFNVLGFLDPDDPELLDHARAIAEAIVQKEPNSRDPHWHQKVEIFIVGVIASVVSVCPPEHRSLQEVASIMSDKTLLSGAIQALQQSSAQDGLLARLGNEMSLSTGKELEGILSTANRSLAFLSTPAVVESTRAVGGFNPEELGNSAVSVFLILPAQYLRSQGGPDAALGHRVDEKHRLARRQQPSPGKRHPG